LTEVLDGGLPDPMQRGSGENIVDRYAVIGNPVAHSLSPRIHAAFARQTGQRLRYDRLLAPLDGFREVADRFFAAGGKGLNVTVPFKAEAADWVDELDPLARLAGAVNTIRADALGRVGFNTDGIGLLRDLEVNQGESLAGARVLLLGAGGAARGALASLLAAGPEALVVANRTLARAETVVAGFARETAGVILRAAAFAELDGKFDVVINATSAGLDDAVPAVPAAVLQGAFAYDMMYGRATAFCTWAQSHGARRAVDGLGMLVEQAAEAFRIWRGVQPVTGDLLVALSAER
jgi:shikimate dehydrogenase